MENNFGVGAHCHSPKAIAMKEYFSDFICPVVIFGALVFSDYAASPDNYRLAIRPAMVAAAEQGRPEAVLWIFKHTNKFFTVEDYAKLKVAVDQGQPESMWLYSQYLRKHGDTAGADQLRARAAEKGFVDAIADLQKPTQLAWPH
jgi:hypothetical protein